MFRAYQLSKYFLPMLIMLSAVLGLLRFNSLQLGTSHDDAHYIILAESLSSGQGYQLINFPKPQVERAFPPGWPILLTPLTFLFPANYTALKLLTLILWLASLFLIHKFFSKKIESPYLKILTGLIAINPLLVGTSVTVMSETAYLFFSLLMLILFDRWENQQAKGNYGLVILIASAALYAQLIRTVGISIFVALLIYFLITRRFREAGLTLGVFGLSLLLQIWMNLRNGGSMISAGYESQVFNGSVIEKIGQMWSNMLGYFSEVLASALVPAFGDRVTALIGPSIPILANAIIILLILLGIILTIQKIHLADIYFVIYILAILAFWNPRVGSVKARFLIPIIPFLYYYLMQGIKWSTNKLTKNNTIYTLRIVIVLTGMLLLLSLARNLQDWISPVREQITDLSIGADWIAQNAPQSAIIMVTDPIPAYVHIHRNTLAYPSADLDLDTYLNNQHVDYIVVSPRLQSPRSNLLDEFTENQLLPFLNSSPERFQVMFESPENNVIIYKYIK